MTSRRFDDRQVLLWITIAVVMDGLLYLAAPTLTPVLFAVLAYSLRLDIQVSKNRLFKRVASGVYNARAGWLSS